MTCLLKTKPASGPPAIDLVGYKGVLAMEKTFTFVSPSNPATILQNQSTVDTNGRSTELMGRGRHDPVVPRAIPIVESMAALVLIEYWMRQHAQCHSFNIQG